MFEDHSRTITLAAVAGTLLMGAVGWGVAAETMSPATLTGTLFALLFAIVGPGVDDYAGAGAIVMAPVGALIGWVGFRHRGRATRPSMIVDPPDENMMEPLDINGVPSDLVGLCCDAIFCQEFWHAGQLDEPANVTFLCFEGRWVRLYFDHGIIFWRETKQGPEPFDAPEWDASYRIVDVATSRGLVGAGLLRYEMEPTKRGSLVTFTFEGGGRLMFEDVDDSTLYRWVKP